MKRVIYSMYQPNIPKVGFSVDNYKQDQFEKYKDRLIKCKQEYADLCDADFFMHFPELSDYTALQYEKIRLLEEYAESYDEVLYLDFDVIPAHSSRNMFECVDLSKINMHPFKREIKPYQLRTALTDKNVEYFDDQTMFVKICAKKTMLMLEDVSSNDLCYNTGVICAGSEVIKSIKFIDKLDEMKELLDESKEDSLYPETITKHFSYNNEVFMSYIIERYNIPHVNLAMNWNYIIDDRMELSFGGYDLLHMVSKNFELKFGE